MTAFYIIISFITSALISMLLMPWILCLCKRNGYFDRPNIRKVHKNPVPRLGGVVFMPAAIIGLSASLYAIEDMAETGVIVSISTLVMAAGAFLVYFIGIFDDRFGMKASHKFVIQGISALFLPLCGLLITDLNGILGMHEISIWVGYPLTVLLIMTIVNAINLIDGIDGLASGLCIFILSAYSYVFAKSDFPLIASLDAAIVGSLVVFWCFNVFGKIGHNKIFMGDAGSLFLGYICAYMSIKSLMHPIAPVDCGEEQMLISVTLLLIPVLDVIRVTFQRFLSGRAIFQPDKTHIHHLFMAAGLSMHSTLTCILVLFGLICGINYALWQSHFILPIILLVDVLIYASVITALLHVGQTAAQSSKKSFLLRG
ncbi:MAG: undecaprenyl/decaprenyl-phosphate alpha-N-acetylglucosaminyl 1-phosphate transferase [Bacteroidaceae bacterium]|nr:undecaprenyl/decaprenyl-phosphate alpha-N-acetylglucosaminyl 1-phosphate transferase [Bacteroidaceae bacterium]